MKKRNIEWDILLFAVGWFICITFVILTSCAPAHKMVKPDNCYPKQEAKYTAP